LFLDLLEPPDIRNWFSSYVYESPVLGTNDFGDSVCKESEKDDLVVEDTDSEKEETLEEYRKSRNRGEVIIGEKLHSNGFVKCNSGFVNNEQKGQSSREVLFYPSLFFLLFVPPPLLFHLIAEII
jgi:hypothetical protein